MIGPDNRYSFYECGSTEPKIIGLDPDTVYELVWDDAQEGKRWLGNFNGQEAEFLIRLRSKVYDNNLEPLYPQMDWGKLLETINRRWGAWSG